MKIVLIGGGSYVFAPTVIHDLIVKHRQQDATLALVDLNKEAVELMAAVAQKVAEEEDVNIKIIAETERENVLPGADYVIVSAALQGFKRWQMDYQILKDMGIAEQARENGGLGGLMYTFRSITLVHSIARDMGKHCPQASLLVVTNPLPRVVSAVNNYTDIEATGFCNIAWRSANGYRWLADFLAVPLDRLDVISAGLNHFSWFLQIKDRETDKDLYPLVEEKLQEHSAGNRAFKVLNQWYKQYKLLAAGVVDHHGEFLPYNELIHYQQKPPFHGSEKERQMRMKNLKSIARGKRSWQEVEFFGSSWEHPVDLAIALHNKEKVYFDMVNIPNKDFIKELPDRRIVEVPAETLAGDLQGKKVPAFPEELAAILNKISRIHFLSGKAAVTGDRQLTEQIIIEDPAIIKKETAIAASHKMLEAHSDVLPQFN